MNVKKENNHVRVLEQVNKKRFSGLLQCQEG